MLHDCGTEYICHIFIVTFIDHFSLHNPHFNVVLSSWEFHLNLCEKRVWLAQVAHPSLYILQVNNQRKWLFTVYKQAIFFLFY